MSIKAGRLRHRVDIQRRAELQDAVTGEITYSWVDVWSKVPADIAPLSAREFISAQSLQSEVVARITIRWRAGLNAKMRIKHGETLYNIEGVLPDNVSGLSYITIPVSSGVNNG